MKKIISIMIILFFCLQVSMVLSAVPKDTDDTTQQTIVQEHKNTRKFVSDEITRQRNAFFKEMDKQGKEWEQKAEDMISNAVWKLGLLWAGIMFIVFGIGNFLNRKLEKRRWNKMLDSAKSEIKAEIDDHKQKIDLEHGLMEQRLQSQAEQLQAKEQETNKKVEALRKARPQLVAMQQKIARQQQELQNVMKNIEMFGDEKDGIRR